MHSEFVGIEVDVAPFESADLPTAQACHHLHIEEVAPIFFFLDFLKEGFELFVTEHLLFGIVVFRYRCPMVGFFAINRSLTAVSKAS